MRIFDTLDEEKDLLTDDYTITVIVTVAGPTLRLTTAYRFLKNDPGTSQLLITNVPLILAGYEVCKNDNLMKRQSPVKYHMNPGDIVRLKNPLFKETK